MDEKPFDPVCQFHDEQTVHLIERDGELFVVSEELAKWYADAKPSSTAVIDWVDPETNTIWFTTALPGPILERKR